MDLAGIARLPEPDFLARIQAGQPHQQGARGSAQTERQRVYMMSGLRLRFSSIVSE